MWTPKTFLWATRPQRIDPVLSPVTADTMPWWREGMLPFRDGRFFRPATQIGPEAYVFEVLPIADVPPEALMSCAGLFATRDLSGSPAVGLDPTN